MLHRITQAKFDAYNDELSANERIGEDVVLFDEGIWPYGAWVFEYDYELVLLCDEYGCYAACELEGCDC